jgi:broad specificity phosphatase PhoE
MIGAMPETPIATADIVLIRHGETTYNARHLLNGDPSVPVPLSANGRRQCDALRAVLAPIAWRTVVITPFGRTRESLTCMLPDGPEPVVDPDLGDIDLGFLESQPREAYRSWRLTHGVDEAPDGGESRTAARRRYARALARLAAATADHPTLVVTHDQPIRYLLNALAGDDPILGKAPPVPNATPFAFRAVEIAAGAVRMAT